MWTKSVALCLVTAVANVVASRPDCTRMNCTLGSDCFEMQVKPICVQSGSGHCPQEDCTGRPIKESCTDECTNDNDCSGFSKCCTACSSCKKCKELDFRYLCKNVKCEPHMECQLLRVPCISSNCIPVPVCEKPEHHVGDCYENIYSVSSCSGGCSDDTVCGATEKCCPIAECPDRACTRARPSSFCEYAKCPEIRTCRDVYDPHRNYVMPQCLKTVIPVPNGISCPRGPPLLRLGLNSLEITNCDGVNSPKICPTGYFCHSDTSKAWSVCCRTNITESGSGANPTIRGPRNAIIPRHLTARCPDPKTVSGANCNAVCTNDIDCKRPGTKKCCKIPSCPRKVCVDAFHTSQTCANTVCRLGTECSDEGIIPICSQKNSGDCPFVPCNRSPPRARCNSCKNDGDCSGLDKCCTFCAGCKECRRPDVAWLCRNVKCDPGKTCQLLRVPCVSRNCIPVPVCEKAEIHVGDCPTRSSGSPKMCSNDTNCIATEKCCQFGSNNPVCSPIVPSVFCEDTECPSTRTCRMVYDTRAKHVMPQCLQSSPASSVNCPGGQPLLVMGKTALEVTQCKGTQKSTQCPTGYFCHPDTSNTSAVCCLIRAQPRSGKCPNPKAGPGGDCSVTCNWDSDCPGKQKCCKTTCAKPVCVDPIPTCADITCDLGTKCSESGYKKAVCSRPGACPQKTCTGLTTKSCTHECNHDTECPLSQKCCKGCNGCMSCSKTDYSALCNGVQCGAGKVCKLDNVPCVTENCIPVPVCVTAGSTVGLCPQMGQRERYIDVIQCIDDSFCHGWKCCRINLVWGDYCTDPLPSKCSDAKCPGKRKCYEVYGKFVMPQCLGMETIPDPPAGTKCSNGHHLLTYRMETAICGEVLDQTDCPTGYHCTNATTEAERICCPDP